MRLVRYGQAAMIAALLTLTGNTVWAQKKSLGEAVVAPLPRCKECAVKHACAASECCKATECSKERDGCCTSKKGDAKGACCKDKTSTAKACCGCPFLSKLAKRTAIIMVMPSSLPLPVSCCLEAMGMLPHPSLPALLPPGPHVFLPPMPSPIPAAGTEPTYGYDEAGNLKCIPPVCASSPVVACSIAPTPATTAKVCIRATPSGERLEMGVGEGTSVRCKKMTITINDKEITVSRFDDRVRIRGEDLKATADCVRTEGKDRLILEGDVVLHYKRDGHSANVTGERIELNLSNSALTIQRGAKTTVTPAAHFEK